MRLFDLWMVEDEGIGSRTRQLGLLVRRRAFNRCLDQRIQRIRISIVLESFHEPVLLRMLQLLALTNGTRQRSGRRKFPIQNFDQRIKRSLREVVGTDVRPD